MFRFTLSTVIHWFVNNPPEIVQRASSGGWWWWIPIACRCEMIPRSGCIGYCSLAQLATFPSEHKYRNKDTYPNPFATEVQILFVSSCHNPYTTHGYKLIQLQSSVRRHCSSGNSSPDTARALCLRVIALKLT